MEKKVILFKGLKKTDIQKKISCEVRGELSKYKIDISPLLNNESKTNIIDTIVNLYKWEPIKLLIKDKSKSKINASLTKITIPFTGTSDLLKYDYSYDPSIILSTHFEKHDEIYLFPDYFSFNLDVAFEDENLIFEKLNLFLDHLNYGIEKVNKFVFEHEGIVKLEVIREVENLINDHKRKINLESKQNINF